MRVGVRHKHAVSQHHQRLHLHAAGQRQCEQLPLADGATHERKPDGQRHERPDEFHHRAGADLFRHHQPAGRHGQMFSSVPHQSGLAVSANERGHSSGDQHDIFLQQPARFRREHRNGQRAGFTGRRNHVAEFICGKRVLQRHRQSIAV